MSTLTKFSIPDSLIAAFEQQLNKTDHQLQSFSKLEETGFPGKKNEEYRFTPVTGVLEKILAAEFEINSGKASAKVNTIDEDAFLILINNGKIESTIQLPEGIQLANSEIEGQSDPFGMVNEMFRRATLSLTISGKVQPVIHLHHFSSAIDRSSINLSAIRIDVQPGAACTIIETFSQEGDKQHFSAPVLQMNVSEKSVCHYIRLQQCGGHWSQVYNSTIRQRAESTVHAFVLTTDGLIVRNNFVLEIDGEGAEGNLMGLYLLNGKTLADNHTVVDHRVPNANSNELFKGVMQGNSKGVFNGKIFVRQDAQKTNAFQSNRNIILSESASVNTKPQLEIWADDVKCSHGCTTGQLDEGALFYLQSRGIDKPSAQSMLLDAFAGEVTEKIQSEKIKNFVSQLVREKIAALK